MFADNAWYITSEGEATMVTEGMHYDSYGQSSPYLDNANLENCWCVTAEYEEFYGYVGLGDLRYNSYGVNFAEHVAYIIRTWCVLCRPEW